MGHCNLPALPGPFLRLTPSAAAREKRLEALLAGRDARALGLDEKVEDAELAGSLALSGIAATEAHLAAARRGEPGAPAAAAALLRARAAVPHDTPITVAALLAWHRALLGEGGLRREPLRREGGTEPAPPERIATRLAVFEEAMNGDSGRQLKATEQGALAMARILEIAPFPRGNGRVARLAASHLVFRAGARRPVLRASDRERLEAALVAAYRIHTEPLVTLLAEASGRALDVMIAALEAPA